MKILAQLFSKLFFVTIIACNGLRGFEQNALANALGNLSTQLEQLACQARPFLSQLNLPDTICILDNHINKSAPSREQLKAFAKETCIEVVQLVVAWQDLSTQSFLEQNPDPINAALASALGYKENSIVTCMKRNAFFTILNENIATYKKEQEQQDEEFKFDQDFLDESIGGGYASCGYHTILHLQTLRNAIKNHKYADLANLTNLLNVNDKFGLEIVIHSLNPILEKAQKIILKNEWRSKIIALNGDGNNFSNNIGEWLTSLGIDTLAEQEIQDKEGTHFATFNDQPTSMGDIQIPATTASVIQENYASALRAYKGKNAPKRYAFLVNTANSHWYGIFVTLDTTPALCIIVDSKNSPRYGQYPLAEILKGLFPRSTPKITTSIAHNFTYKRDEKLDAAIFRLETIHAFAKLNDQETITDVIHELKKTRPLDPWQEKYIFERYTIFEPARKYFGTYDKFKEALRKIQKSEEIKLEENIRELITILL